MYCLLSEGDPLKPHVGHRFRTPDNDDILNCARRYGGGWWYRSSYCVSANLNGIYQHTDDHAGTRQGVMWAVFSQFSMKFVEMKIRPFVN